MSINFDGKAMFAILLAGAAWASNPNEDSFRQQLEKIMQNQGANWLDRKVTSLTTQFQRSNYGFFSIINVPEIKDTVFLGVFGQWLPLPTLDSIYKK